MEQTNHFTSIQKWRKEYETKLGAPDGWLSISGLYWLKEGNNRMGADPSLEVVLPTGSAPTFCGEFKYHANQITLEAQEGVTLTVNEKPVNSVTVKFNQYGSSDWFVLNELKFAVIQRGVRYGVRVYDRNSSSRKAFVNLRWFPIDEAYRIAASFVVNDPPTMIPVTNVLGDTSEEPCPGYAEFTVNKQVHRLYPVTSEGEERLWFMFRDSTNGSMTYPGGRFMWAEPPKNNTIVLDFNKAYNPPCAYTDFATCPLPPEINRLSVPVMAGEMKFR